MAPLVYCGLILHLHLTGTRGCERRISCKRDRYPQARVIFENLKYALTNQLSAYLIPCTISKGGFKMNLFPVRIHSEYTGASKGDMATGVGYL